MPSPEIVQALRPEWLRTAAHEAGHAVVATVQGIPVDSARVWYQGHGEHVAVRGLMRPGDGEHVLVGNPSLADAWLLMALAGPAAEALWRQRSESAGAGAARRGADDSSGADLRNARRYLRKASLSFGAARFEALRLVRAHWHGVERTARELSRRGYLPGSSVQV